MQPNFPVNEWDDIDKNCTTMFYFLAYLQGDNELI